MNRLIAQEVSRYPGQQKEVVKYFQENAMAAAQLRAPLYEDKVVDLLISKAEISERTVSRAELEAAIEDEDETPVGHVHGPGCGHDHHDHDHAPKAKKAAKPKAGKPASKTTADEPAKADKPARAAAAQPLKAAKVEKAPAKAAKAETKPAKTPAKKAAAKS